MDYIDTTNKCDLGGRGGALVRKHDCIDSQPFQMSLLSCYIAFTTNDLFEQSMLLNAQIKGHFIAMALNYF